MTATDPTAAFAAFRAAAFENAALLRDLRVPLERDAYVARVVSVGAALGFAFDEAAVRAAMREGELAWLALGSGRRLNAPHPTPPRLCSADRLFGWTPYRVACRGDALWLDWCHLDARRMVEPFFFETILTAMREPFNLAFQQRTPIEALAELPPGLPIAGFVFHMSRCGSTLVAQALAAFESNIVVAEAVPLRFVLRTAAVGRAGPEQAATWLAGLVNAYAQPRFSYEARLVVKFMAADVLDIALIRRAFPDVPWIFVTRDPAEIMASQAASPGIDLARAQIPASRLGLTDDTMWRMEAKAYQAHVLAAFARAAIDAHVSGKGLVLDYSELPDALWTRVLPHLGLTPNAGAVALMQAVARRHSKRPVEPFVPAHDANRATATAFRSVAEPIVGPAMAALRDLKLRAPSALANPAARFVP